MYVLLCHILTLRFLIEDCLLSVHESHDFAYCKHYQYFILSPKYRLLHAYSHICPDIISRLPYLPRGVSQGQIWAEGWYQGRYGNRHVIKSEVWSQKSEVWSLKIPLAFRKYPWSISDSPWQIYLVTKPWTLNCWLCF